jgi:prepilin-type N-terminal cleavage/methylation domain-containing protein
MLSDRGSKGFTIVELLIVIVVISILAALVLNTFSGVQTRARDTERLTDVKAVQRQMEAYYAINGHYLKGERVRDANAQTLLDTYLPGLDPEALRAPGETDVKSSWGQWQGDVDNSGYQYAYKAFTADGSNSSNCTGSSVSDSLCSRYEIYYREEASDEVKRIRSLNGW